MTQTIPAGSTTYTFTWDGKTGPLEDDPYADPWTYTFEVVATQTDSNPVAGQADLTVDDTATYRSKYLDILRSYRYGLPVTEAEFVGVDDNGTPDNPADDQNEYYIRFYSLKDIGNPCKDAVEGDITLYDPDMKVKDTWDVAGLPCVEHDDACDGLEAEYSMYGKAHGLVVKVPISVFDAAGDYKFVLRLKDDHAAEYRDHQKRWALDLNSNTAPVRPVCFFNGHGVGGSLERAWNAIKDAKWIDPNGGAVYGLGPGSKIVDGKRKTLDAMPDFVHGDVVISGLTRGCGGKYPPLIFALVAHGYGGKAADGSDIAGRSIDIDSNWRHTCSISTDCRPTPVDKSENYLISYLASPQDIGVTNSYILKPNALYGCKLAVITGCGSAHNYPTSICKRLKDLGVSNVIGIDNGATMAEGGSQLTEICEKFTELFFNNLVSRGPNGKSIIHLTDGWIRYAAQKAQAVTLETFGTNSKTGIMTDTGGSPYVMLNNELLPNYDSNTLLPPNE